ncbi:flagellar biosynthesis anti-sigma factor FlgM [Thiohalorhabdus methylotrophus]|uniref:Negative regulator of flagellin synthesis n=1 Tax=Thiohalorhabdus methylotrophus TaxID=3242694 RepID=A0ABV4TWG8_9GAMM
MRIDGKNNNPRRTSRSGKAGTGSSESAGSAASGSGSGEAARMDLNLPQLRGKLESLPDVRESRVEALKDAIDRGEYEVGGREVVSRVLSNVLLENLK